MFELSAPLSASSHALKGDNSGLGDCPPFCAPWRSLPQSPRPGIEAAINWHDAVAATRRQAA